MNSVKFLFFNLPGRYIIRLVILLLLFPVTVFAGPEIYLAKSWTKINYPDLAHLAADYDVILLGEEHDDERGHDEKFKLIHFLNKNSERKIILGLEMLEKDRQDTVNEFLSGIISHSSFLQSVQPNNVKNYFQILSYAQKEAIPVIATNAPRKYVNIVSRKGMEGLAQLPPEAVRNLPPLYLVDMFRQIEYENKVKQAFSFHSHDVQLERMMKAMYLWDTAMADSIASASFYKDKLFIHINGRYHSDEGFGITYRLQKTGLRVLAVSMIPLKNRTGKDARYADIIYYTGE